MPNSTSDKFDKAALLAAWMDGQLSAEQREQFESLCSTDAEFANQIQIANQATLLANDYQTENDSHYCYLFIHTTFHIWYLPPVLCLDSQSQTKRQHASKIIVTFRRNANYL